MYENVLILFIQNVGDLEVIFKSSGLNLTYSS